jgi:excinuclease UvrABC nuclease subunit
MVVEPLLEARGFVTIPVGKRISGVYVLLRYGDIIYVGQSKALFSRLDDHMRVRKARGPVGSGDERTNKMRFIPFTHIMIKWCSEQKALELEAELINRYKPEYNIRVPEPMVDYEIDIDALVAMIEMPEQEERQLTRRFD